MQFISYFILLILFSIPRVYFKPTKRIINGQTASRFEFPFVVTLNMRNNKSYCGGILLDSITVLTAAHCFAYYHSFTIVAGEYNLKTDDCYEAASEIQTKILHEKYKRLDEGETIYDVALVQLKTPIYENSAIKYATLTNKEITPNTDCLSIGWGKTNVRYSATILQKTTLTILETKLCKTLDVNLTENDVFCAQRKKTGICNGDSGNPLVCNIDGKQVVSGITSYSFDYWNYTICNIDEPNYYANVYPLLDWIHKNRRVLLFEKLQREKENGDL